MPQTREAALARGVTRIVSEKRCSKCGETKPADDFPAQLERTTGLGSWCKACVSIRNRARRYGLCFDTVAALLRDWPITGCQICGSTKGTPHFDHDHETDEFRGVLCHRCNIGISILDNPALLTRAQEYLQ